jgi:adenine phosphoribosyltransferase
VSEPVPVDLDAIVRRIPNHPKPGILFFDLMPLFEDAAGLAHCVERCAEFGRAQGAELVVGAEARGFILGGAIAHAMDVGFAAARKPGKLPHATLRHEYALEYGTDALEIHRSAIRPGTRVLIHDDLLATGGTAKATCELVEALGGVVAGLAFIAELTFLPGREALSGYDVMSLITFAAETM